MKCITKPKKYIENTNNPTHLHKILKQGWEEFGEKKKRGMSQMNEVMMIR